MISQRAATALKQDIICDLTSNWSYHINHLCSGVKSTVLPLDVGKNEVAKNGSTQVKYKYFKTVLKNSRD